MKLFGLPIMVFDNLCDNNYRQHLLSVSESIMQEVDTSEDWLCDVSSTCQNYDIMQNPEYDRLVKLQMPVCTNFLRNIGVQDSITPVGGWLNSYTDKQFQEQHKHPNVYVSSVYFLDAPEGSAPLMFHNPNMSDLTFKYVSDSDMVGIRPVDAVTNRLVVFLSWSPHSVPQGTNKDLRWTIATNYTTRY